jgi:serine/threonine protein kinase
MSLSAGTRLGPYEIVAPLGAAGMGEVYRACDTRLGRVVALKVLPISLHGDPALQARFEREAQALAALNHPRIAAIHDVVDVGDHRAIVMEFVPGPTLAEVIAQGPGPLRTAIGYAIDIADALSVAHAAGIVHRDLKPANVVITDDGSAKVLDFGIAKLGAADDSAAREGATNTSLTADRALVGTIGYMSPEQAHCQPVDARGDIFSLGVVLHEMISGRPAFHGDTTAALLAAVLRDDPPPLRTLAPATPRVVERLVTRCLQKDPRRRYQAAADLKVVLEDARDDLASPESARAMAPTDRQWLQVRSPGECCARQRSWPPRSPSAQQASSLPTQSEHRSFSPRAIGPSLPRCRRARPRRGRPMAGRSPIWPWSTASRRSSCAASIRHSPRR